MKQSLTMNAWPTPTPEEQGNANSKFVKVEQCLLIVSEADLVIVTNGWNTDEPGLKSQRLLERTLVALKALFQKGAVVL